MNFSLLLAGLYVIISVGMLREYPNTNIYLIILLFSVGIVLISAVARAFIKTRDAIKVVAITLLMYVGLGALADIIRGLLNVA